VKVQLITFAGCPNAGAARELLRRCLSLAGLEPTFEEIDSTAPETPEQFREWGSPTVLVNGVDIAGQEPTGPGCRLYRDGAGHVQTSPPERLLRDAFEAARRG